MRWALFFKTLILTSSLACPAYSIQRVHSEYGDEQKVKDEFDNMFRNAQDERFRIMSATPTVAEMKEGQIVVVSTGTEKPRLFLLKGTSQYYFNSNQWR